VVYVSQPLGRRADLPGVFHAETDAPRVDRHNGGELAIRDPERSIWRPELNSISRREFPLLGTEYSDAGET
jgi:hypothetical protein